MDLQVRKRYMQAMGIPVWMPKASVEEEIPPAPPFSKGGVDMPLPVVPSSPLPVAPDCSTLSWQDLRTAVQSCTRCAISKTRTQTVFGTGNQQAAWMVIGEAPGAEEDRQGEPFVGKAGQLLNNMLLAIGMPRETVYIANVLKCRPPNNRDPHADEAANCRGYLERQITLVNPTLILVVGRIAAQNLLQTTAPLARLRGQEHHVPVSGTPVVVTYHPAYLLRQPSDKRKAWQDLLFAREVFARHAQPPL
ncbi:DNA polymerase [Thiothrix caldifontis]|uniref:Type-4 uracil-DNA glycosylase n=1 Tax=Thiothrix caldifontis TaxID=525918 RepID=A0A1H4G954_9GAMM|nr:uracil-DNA glycosylase [Thiothrix caldifontis]SEB05550.1 DNA polymerase [Thiothrix caldifontis]